MSVFWKAFAGGFLGRLAATMLVAVFISLGIGPDRWIKFLIQGLPEWITPKVARLVLLLFAGVTFLLIIYPIIKRWLAKEHGLKVEIQDVNNTSKGAENIYMSCYEAIHYIAQESIWGVETAAKREKRYISKLGGQAAEFRWNPLLFAPVEFHERAQEGKVRVYGFSSSSHQQELIPIAHWMSHGLKQDAVFNADIDCETQPRTSKAHGAAVYSNLKIVAEDVYKAWPRNMKAEGDGEEDFEHGFAKAKFERSPTRENTIDYLTHLRRKGVATRNLASNLLLTTGLNQWINEVDIWKKAVTDTLNSLNRADSVWFDVLDVVPPPRVPIPQVRLGGDSDRSQFIDTFCQHDYRLKRLEDLLKKYGVG